MKNKNINYSNKNKNVGECPEYFDNELIQVWENIKSICPDGTFELSNSIFLETMSCFVFSIKSKQRTLDQDTLKALNEMINLCKIPPKSRHELLKLINSN